MILGFTPRGSLGNETIHEALKVGSPDGDEELVVNLRSLTFCDPAGLVAIAAIIEHAHVEGRSARVLAPSNSDVANYLSRMRLGRHLNELSVTHDLPEVREWPTDMPLLELRAFDGAMGAGELAAAVHRAVERFDLDAANTLYECLCETGQNVAHHSGQDRGFMALQRTYGGSVMRFAVADAGVGMLSTLRARGAQTELEAVRMALTDGVSQIDDAARGAGLAEVVAQAKAMRGDLCVISGNARLVRTRRGDRPRELTTGFPGALLQGKLQIE